MPCDFKYKFRSLNDQAMIKQREDDLFGEQVPHPDVLINDYEILQVLRIIFM